ncbi:Organic cation transporter-like protein [Tribolium castaneum]|uniref:Organic cation transporter-like protein n=1 Tax=Tribolium castaneum TaxID=7070 RepID=D7EL70_TRICA|nr:Organic cation transporter-like protein [Tribolium castaneum]
MDVEYRCEVPKCDRENSHFDPPWIQNAVPFIGAIPAKCMRYVVNITDDLANCTEESVFMTTKLEKCNKFVYKTREKSILHEYNLHCDENVWKLALVGTVNNMGQFLSMFFSGIISDKLVNYFLYTPPLFLFVYFWIIPESIRWNLSKGKTDDAKNTLRQVASVNGKELSEHSLEKLFKTPILICRLVVCFFCWMTCSFLFFGLTLNSVGLAGNNYLDFILTCLVEIPAYFACIYIVDRLGRRWSLSGSFFITGISCCVYTFIPAGFSNLSLTLWLLAKFGATAAYTVIFVVTSELFPTSLRHSLVGACSTFATIGSMVAPQTPLLAKIWDPLPAILYTIMAVIAGFLTLLFPETVDVTLPDTIEEAVRIGKSKRHI